MIAILLNSWPLTLQIMQGLMNIRKWYSQQLWRI
jgi:hypothetical protein